MRLHCGCLNESDLCARHESQVLALLDNLGHDAEDDIHWAGACTIVFDAACAEHEEDGPWREELADWRADAWYAREKDNRAS